MIATGLGSIFSGQFLEDALLLLDLFACELLCLAGILYLFLAGSESLGMSEDVCLSDEGTVALSVI